MERAKIELYKTRTFSEKLNDTIGFMRESWRTQLKYFIYLMLPCSIVLAFFLNHFFSGYMSLIMAVQNVGDPRSDVGSFLLNAGAMLIAFMVTYALLIALVYALVRLYRARGEDRLKNLTTEELKPELMFCLRRSCMLMLATIVIAIVVLLVFGGLMAGAFVINPGFGLMSLMLLYIALLVVALPMMLVTPIYMLEDDISIIPAFQKAFHLGIPTWGGIFAVVFVLGIIASIIQTVTMGPWYILFIVKMVFTLSNDLDGSFTSSIFYTFAEYITCVLQCLGMLFSSVLTIVGLTIQYGHAADKIDGVGVVEKIEQFDEFDNF
ncbi:MAG: hypothetical protein IJ887_16910 [Prevotella sp.]|nr:hypothetical protein [Prevotella sp.]MBR6187654.1 hypothetical protein [Prevotella sp.]